MRRPTLEAGFPDYDDECERVLEPHIQMLFDRAHTAGWDRQAVARAVAKLIYSVQTTAPEPASILGVTGGTGDIRVDAKHETTKTLRP